MNKLNKLGFTLIELLAVISILAIIAVIATPNVINMLDNSKKNTFVSDAQAFISKAKYMNKLDKYQSYFVTTNNCKTITLKSIANTVGISVTKDPDNNLYSLNDTSIKMCEETVNSTTTINWYIKTVSYKDDGITKGRGILNSLNDGYVLESNLSNNDVKQLATES